MMRWVSGEPAISRPCGEGVAELLERRRLEVGRRYRRCRRIGGIEAGSAAIEEPRKLPHQAERGRAGGDPAPGQARTAAAPTPAPLCRAKNMDQGRHIDQGIVAIGSLPVDEPQPLAIEQDVRGIEVVVTGDQCGAVPGIGLADALKALAVTIEQARCEQAGIEQAAKQGSNHVKDSRTPAERPASPAAGRQVCRGRAPGPASRRDSRTADVPARNP